MPIIQVPSPNFTKGRAGYTPFTIVVHIMEGSLSGTDSWFKSTTSQVSAHYGIGINGEVHQYVQEENSAWHAGRVNNPSWPLIISSGAGKYVNPNYYTIGIEHEGNENSDWSDAMYLSSSTMIREISQRWNIPLDRQHIIGHHEIYSLKTCPGNKVDFDKLISMAAVGLPQVQANAVPQGNRVTEFGKVTTQTKLNIRSSPSTSGPVINIVPVNIQLAYDGYVADGESISGNNKWFFTDEGNWFWSGGVK